MPCTRPTGYHHKVAVAPVRADGSIIYWDIDKKGADATRLIGFRAGQKDIKTLVEHKQVSRDTFCIGCHATTPDGMFVAFTNLTKTTGGENGGLTFASVDGQMTKPAYITPSTDELNYRDYASTPGPRS